MSEPRHEPVVRYLCDDPDCCWDGTPVAICAADGQDWPCDHRRAKDSPGRTAAHVRWRGRVRGLEPRPDGQYLSGKL